MYHFIMTLPWAIILILLPLIGAIISFLWSKQGTKVGIVAVTFVLISVIFFTWFMVEKGVYLHTISGWAAPLGINLYADGLSLIMLIMTALVVLGISVYAMGYFSTDQAKRFWPLWLLIIAGLNALFLSSDIFNYYVTLELIGLAAVALTALGNTRKAFVGAMRYLLATLLGSLLYLFGVGLLYHGFGSLDLAILSQNAEATPILWVSLALISAGLLLKTALFPLHFWLPPAHSSAPAPVSALLSALIIKSSFYILVRVWVDIFGPLSDGTVASIFGFLGMLAILWGSFQALRQTRLKLLVAYSTVAQIGYLFVAFSLALSGATTAWNAVVFLAFAHALAKSAMFLVVGNLLRFGGHDEIIHLDRVAQRLPITTVAFGLAGISIIGLPLSGGFIGKYFLLEAALLEEQWGFIIILLIGSLLSAAYIFKVMSHFFTPSSKPHDSNVIPANMEWSALLLAVIAILLGLFAASLLSIIDLGSPFELKGDNV
ncbi:MAG: Oxidoreductase [uncultured Sulfurovum sp.]|uniref:Oxidoreductase n=1 Tax=uncultured Sulfurovum sp. TaxID=269237 RepID=A0A6S6T146_9BACT|nr:MAG: Oxidoreductase [uncultured Sulfurovum sp.]